MNASPRLSAFRVQKYLAGLRYPAPKSVLVERPVALSRELGRQSEPA